MPSLNEFKLTGDFKRQAASVRGGPFFSRCHSQRREERHQRLIFLCSADLSGYGDLSDHSVSSFCFQRCPQASHFKSSNPGVGVTSSTVETSSDSQFGHCGWVYSRPDSSSTSLGGIASSRRLRAATSSSGATWGFTPPGTTELNTRETLSSARTQAIPAESNCALTSRASGRLPYVRNVMSSFVTLWIIRGITRGVENHGAVKLEFSRDRVARIRVVVEAFTAFASVPAGHHHAFQKSGRGEAPLLEFLEHDLTDVVGGVEADEIEQGEGTHGISAAQLHGVVDIGNRAHAFFIGADGIQQIRHQQAVHDEAGLVAGAHRRLAQAFAKFESGLEGRFAGGDGAHHLDQ